MQNMTFRQMSTLVTNNLLSYLTDDALVQMTGHIARRRDPASAGEFASDPVDPADLDAFEKAVADEIAARKSA